MKIANTKLHTFGLEYTWIHFGYTQILLSAAKTDWIPKNMVRNIEIDKSLTVCVNVSDTKEVA